MKICFVKLKKIVGKVCYILSGDVGLLGYLHCVQSIILPLIDKEVGYLRETQSIKMNSTEI